MKSSASLTLLLLLSTLTSSHSLAATPDSALAARAVNALGLKLLTQNQATNANLLWSPYSIQNALAMTWAGADGLTWKEMTKVLNFGTNEPALHASFGALGQSLDQMRQQTEALSAESRKFNQLIDPISLVVANRLFGEKTFAFRPAFLALTRERYGAPLEAVDFLRHADQERRVINQWVSGQTRDRIQDLIPQGALNQDTRLVLVNAIYLKAPWQDPFEATRTRPEPFHVPGTKPPLVATMNRKAHFGYRPQKGFSAITLPYLGGDLQFLILLPDTTNGLGALEKSLTADTVASSARLPQVELDLHLPKLHLQPPVMALGKSLRALGMTSAFDVPPGSANFDRMAPRRTSESLKISDVFHKTFLDLDEKGTEAAAATAVSMVATSLPLAPKPKPILVRVDHPFLFAIQHRPSGACLFLGRIVDPR